MTCAIIRRFGFFQISGFFQSGNLRVEHLAQTNARGLMNSFRTTRAHGAFISTIRQILYSFVKILNTR